MTSRREVKLPSYGYVDMLPLPRRKSELVDLDGLLRGRLITDSMYCTLFPQQSAVALFFIWLLLVLLWSQFATGYCHLWSLSNTSATFLLVGSPSTSWLWWLNAAGTLSTGLRERMCAFRSEHVEDIACGGLSLTLSALNWILATLPAGQTYRVSRHVMQMTILVGTAACEVVTWPLDSLDSPVQREIWKEQYIGEDVET